MLDWLREWMGMPDGTEGVLVSGGSVGTLTALAAAAHGRDRRSRPGDGLRPGAHARARSPRRGACSASTPPTCACCAPTRAHRLQPAAVDAALQLDREAGLEPFVVIGTAGTTSTGSVDPLADLADLAEREDLWFHVDGAYGAPARLTPAGTDLLDGHRARRLARARPAQVALPAVRDRRGPDPPRRACSSRRSRSTAPTCATRRAAWSSSATAARSSRAARAR